VKKKILVSLAVSLMMLSVVLAQGDEVIILPDGTEKVDTLVIRTELGTDYYCGRLIYTGISSVEVVKNGGNEVAWLPVGYEVEVRVHKWDNIDFATWDRDFGSLVVFQGDYDGIYVIDVLLYKYGNLIDTKHIVYNFQEESYKLRFI